MNTISMESSPLWDRIWNFSGYRNADVVKKSRTHIVINGKPVSAGQVDGAKAILEQMK